MTESQAAPLISFACSRGGHAQCRRRVLRPGPVKASERWTACECPCGHTVRKW